MKTAETYQANEKSADRITSYEYQWECGDTGNGSDAKPDRRTYGAQQTNQSACNQFFGS